MTTAVKRKLDEIDSASALHVVAHRLEGSSIALDVDASATAADLQRALVEPSRVPIARQRLVHAEAILDGNALLKSLADASGRVDVQLVASPKAHATVHQVSVDGEECDGATMDREVKTMHPELLSQRADHGDLVENLAQSGYRMCGIYIVHKTKDDCSIRDLDCDVEEYGGIPSWVNVATSLPFNYWDLEKMHVERYGTAVERNQDIGCSFHTEDCTAPIGIPPDFCSGATNEAADDDGIQFDLNGQTFKIKGASSLKEVRELGLVLGTDQATVGEVMEC